MSANVSKLRVGDEDFLVASMIERCPRRMMPRELVQNAVEAAMSAPPGRRVVEISALPVGGVPKLAIWNSGRGLEPDELYRMCDLASSINKVKGLDRNFGMGAKVASLPSNQHGMRYRSCRHGRVHEVVLGKRDGIYGRLRRARPGGGAPTEVLEVTEEAKAEGRSAASDWTEVVLLGNAAEQDTVRAPYGDEFSVQADWLAEALYLRFWSLPEGLELRMLPGSPKRGEGTVFRPISARMRRDFTRHEAVRLPYGLTIHYLYDAENPQNPYHNLSGRGALQADWSHGALVHRGEMYDVAFSGEWTNQAIEFGIGFAARRFSVHVELPDDAPVRPDGYRQVLQGTEGGQALLKLRDYAAVVATHRPAWLLELLQQLTPKSNLAQGVQAELSRLLRRLGVTRRSKLAEPAWEPAIPPPPEEIADAAAPPEPEAVLEVSPPRRRRRKQLEETAPPPEAPSPPEPPLPQVATEEQDGFEVAPDILFLRDEREISERWMQARAARYYPDANQLCINLHHPSVDMMATALEEALSASIPLARLRPMARAEAESALAQRVGRALVFALSKRDAAEHWQHWQIENALSSEALTLAGDDWEISMPAALAAIQGGVQAAVPVTRPAAA